MRITIIVDASYCSDTGAAGYGYWLASERGKQGGGGSMKGAVSNSTAAEMLGVCNALFIGVKDGLVRAGDHVLVQTDCLAAIGGFQGRRQMKVEQEKEAARYFHSLRNEQGFGVTFRHVKGHTTRTEARFVTNNLCDKRAKEGMRRARAQMKRMKT